MTYLIRRKKIRESEKEKEGAKAAAPAWIAVLDFFQDQAHELLGILEAAVDSKRQGSARLETPHLGVRYQTPTSDPIRPREPRPQGASTVAWAASEI